MISVSVVLLAIRGVRYLIRSNSGLELIANYQQFLEAPDSHGCGHVAH